MKTSSHFKQEIPIQNFKDKRRFIEFTQSGNSLEIELIDEFDKPQPLFKKSPKKLVKKNIKWDFNKFNFDAEFYTKIFDRILRQKRCGSVKINFPQGSDIVKNLLEPFLKACSEDSELFRAITDNSPDLLSKISQHISLEKKRQNLLKYESMLKNKQLQEADWQKYFLDNRYILSNGLSTVKILTPIYSQPSLGGLKIDGTGTQKSDFYLPQKEIFTLVILVKLKSPKLLYFLLPTKNVILPAS